MNVAVNYVMLYYSNHNFDSICQPIVTTSHACTEDHFSVQWNSRVQ